jgi:hypothetical protein
MAAVNYTIMPLIFQTYKTRCNFVRRHPFVRHTVQMGKTAPIQPQFCYKIDIYSHKNEDSVSLRLPAIVEIWVLDKINYVDGHISHFFM